MKRFYKLISICLVVFFSSFCFMPTYTFASWVYPNHRYSPYRNYHPGYYHPHRHHRHDNNNSVGWWLLGALVVGGIVAANNNSSSSETYSDKYGKIISNLTPEETAIYESISKLEKSTIQGVQYFNDEDLSRIVKLLNKFYGEYLYLGTVYQNGKNFAVFYKFSTIFESEKVNKMEYYDFVSTDLLHVLTYDKHYIPYNEKLAKKIGANLKRYYPNSICYKSGNSLVIEKQ